MNTDENISDVKLRRVLSLSDLIIYGIILIQPVAALPLYGHANHISKGHAVTTILIAMAAMIFTAISYGRMAQRYPSSGSAYVYVGKGISPYLGFVAGWAMFMDYLFIPILCVIFTSIAASHLLPVIPYHLWILFFAGGFTLLNLNGIKVASRTNWILMVIMSVVVFYFMAMAIRYILLRNGFSGLISIEPFYNKDSFSIGAVGSATALAALTYIGFDGLTEYFFKSKNITSKSVFRDLLPPLVGFLFCLTIWLNLPLKTFIIGGSWMIIGIIYLAFQTNGFRKRPRMLEIFQK